MSLQGLTIGMGPWSGTVPLGIHALGVCMLVSQLCPTLCEPMDWGLTGFFVHGILQARILECVAMPVSRGSSQPGSSALQADSLPSEPPTVLEITINPTKGWVSSVQSVTQSCLTLCNPMDCGLGHLRPKNYQGGSATPPISR